MFLSGSNSVWNSMSVIWQRLSSQVADLSASSLWITFGQLLLFALVFVVVTFIGWSLVRRFKAEPVRADLPMAAGLGLWALFVLQLLSLMVARYSQMASSLIFWLGLVLWLVIARDHLGNFVSVCRSAFSRRRIVWLVVLLALSVSWLLPSALTGQTDTKGAMLVSSELGGERLLFPAYNVVLNQGLPAEHPFWDNALLSYHYFGMVAESSWQRFGLDVWRLHFLYLPWLLAALAASLIAVMSYRLSGKRASWYVAPIIFLWWENMSFILSPSFRESRSPQYWWLSVFEGHHHAYMNGSSHQHTTVLLLTVLAMILALPIIKKAKQAKWVVLLAVMSATIILFKAQTFIIIGLLWALAAVRYVYFAVLKRPQSKLFLYFSLGFIFATAIILLQNRASLFSGSGGIEISPFFQIIDREITQSAAAVSMFNYLSEHLGSRTIALSILMIFSVLMTYGLKLLGLGASSQRDDRWSSNFVRLLKLIAVSGIILMYLLYITLGNQWQFLYPVVAVLSILTAVFLVERARWWIFVLLCIGLVPGTIGTIDMYTDESYVRLSSAQLSLSRQIGNSVRAGDRCLYIPPFEQTEDDPAAMTPATQANEVAFVVNSSCPLSLSSGPRVFLNGTFANMPASYTVYEQMKKDSGRQVLIDDYLPRQDIRFILSPNENRYRLTDIDYQRAGYTRADQVDGWSLWARY